MSNEFISSVWQFTDHNYDQIHDIFRWFWKLPPQLVNRLINMYSNENDLVLANFWWSWTVLIESIINNRICTSFDINPTAILIWNTKIWGISMDIEKIKSELKKEFESCKYENELTDYEKKRFEEDTIRDIYRIKQAIQKFKNDEIYNFLLFNLIAIIRKCSLVDSRCINHIVVDKNKKTANPFDEYLTLLSDNYNTIKDFNEKYPNNNSIYSQWDARKIIAENDSYDLIISHPPYLWNVNYSNINQLQNYVLWYEYSDVKTKDLSTESLSIYLDNMYKVIDEMIRVIKPWKKICLIIWDSRKKWNIIPTFSYFINYGIEKWLNLKDVFIWILQWKAWNSIKRHWNFIDHNYVLVFEK